MNFKLKNLTKNLSHIPYYDYSNLQTKGLSQIIKYLPVSKFTQNLKEIINHVKKELVTISKKVIRTPIQNKKKDYKVCTLFNRILNNEDVYLIKQSKDTIDPYTRVFMCALDSQIRFMNSHEFNKYIKPAKYTFITEFNTNNYYSKYNYSPKNFKKSDLDDIFANNKPLPLNMLCIIANVLSVNLVYINTSNLPEYFTNFIEDWVTIVIFETNSDIFTIHSKKTQYIRGVDIKKYINIPFSSLSDRSMPELHNLCRMKNIEYKKMGKTKKINKLKCELVCDLLK